MADAPPPGFKEIPPPAGFKEVADVPRGEGDKAAPMPATPESIQRGIFGAGQPKPLDVVQRVGNVVLPPLVTVPAETALTLGGGALATKALPQFPRLAGATGRAVTTGAIGGLESGSVGRGAVDAGVAATFEAALSAAPYVKGVSSLRRLAEGVAGKRREFERATASVDAAFDAIAPRVPSSGKWLYVPALSAHRLSTDEARAALKKAEGATFEAAWKQIVAELKTLDKRAAKSPTIGQNLYTAPEFAAHALPQRFTPPVSEAERFAENVIGGLKSPATRATVDAAATMDEGGIPSGVAPFAVLGERLKDLAPRWLHR